MSRSRRFTLIELMVVVAIVGVLAAIGIPIYSDYQLRARAAEVPLILDGMNDAVAAWAREVPFEGTLGCSGNGGCTPGSSQQPDYPDPSLPLGKQLGYWHHRGPWAEIDFEPDGGVRCAYSLQIFSASYDADNVSMVYSMCDLDVNGEVWNRLQFATRGTSTPRTTEDRCLGGETPTNCQIKDGQEECTMSNEDGVCL